MIQNDHRWIGLPGQFAKEFTPVSQPMIRRRLVGVNGKNVEVAVGVVVNWLTTTGVKCCRTCSLRAIGS